MIAREYLGQVNLDENGHDQFESTKYIQFDTFNYDLKDISEILKKEKKINTPQKWLFHKTLSLLYISISKKNILPFKYNYFSSSKVEGPSSPSRVKEAKIIHKILYS